MEGPFHAENSIFRVKDERNIAYVPMYTHMTVFAIRLSTNSSPTSLSGLSRQAVAYSSGLFRADTSVASRRSPAPHPPTSCRRAGQVRPGLAKLALSVGSSLALHYSTCDPSNLTRLPNTRLCRVRNRPLPPPNTPERSLDCVLVNCCIQYLKARLFKPHACRWLTRRRAKRPPQAARELATDVGNAVSRYVMSCTSPWLCSLHAVHLIDWPCVVRQKTPIMFPM
jgi:hypothetical protein